MDRKHPFVLTSWGLMPPPWRQEVTAPELEGPDPVTQGVTAAPARSSDRVTPSTWEDIASDCFQARQEILGVLEGLDPGIPPKDRYPQTEAYVGVATEYLRKAVSALEAAIASIQVERPGVKG